MRRVFLILLFVVMLVAPIFGLAGSAMADSSNANIPGYTLVFDDEFDGETSLNSNYQEYWGGMSASWWNGKNSLILENGLLRLKINKENVYQNGQNYNYTAAGFNQLTQQTYGRWSIRARFPQGMGTQTYIGLWRKDFKWPPEIDFAEVRGMLPQVSVFVQHYAQGGQNLSEVFNVENMNFTTEFHEYTLDWGPGNLTLLVDGVEKYTTTPKYEAFPMELVVADLVGTCDSFSGCPDGSNTYPTYMDIDYIRIYQKN